MKRAGPPIRLASGIGFANRIDARSGYNHAIAADTPANQSNVPSKSVDGITPVLDYRSIMDGTRRGPAAALLRVALALASVGYRAVVHWRNRAFDRGARESVRVDVPVISIGNLTTGGTGKTPLVAALAKWFRARGVRVSIVSRGYGRGDADENDEAAELHQRLSDVPHVQDPDRVRAAQIAIAELETQLILMDDGFQHRRLRRDLDIVLIDATCPFGFGHLLPRGLLREPIANVRRADAVIITRTDQVPETRLRSITEVVRRYHATVPIMRCRHRVTELLIEGGQRLPATVLDGASVALLCGIGNPDAFRATVLELGVQIVSERLLSDHASYDRQSIQEIERWLGSLPPFDYVVCTQKDLVKIRSDRLAGHQIVAVAIEADLEWDDVFRSQLERIVKQVGGDGPQPD
jgi:tetraacyldisaccharide 4'-kinase